MLRWLLIVVLALLLFQGLRPWLERMGLGRLPGDVRFRLRGREVWLPLGTTVALSLIAALIGHLI
ncbi:MAG TPA: DUF2905 domain-containing protein [Methylibium sp.]|uniref:DUF2905 domain-containing protein n=1 Tax=Methylibium sp. TaxID=2067992 RepID=UPI002DB77FAE|nr:DUF2905 domain-containing protein [Methylibium sp.]HEU4460888.1 DUF2905 domain-containing protein [Methylibium sp.]